MENPSSAINPTPARDNSRDRNAEFKSLSKELAEKELELSTLERRLSWFEERYARKVGILYAELDEIEREIAKELMRLKS